MDSSVKEIVEKLVASDMRFVPLTPFTDNSFDPVSTLKITHIRPQVGGSAPGGLALLL